MGVLGVVPVLVLCCGVCFGWELRVSTVSIRVVGVEHLITRVPLVVFETLRKSFWCRAGFEPAEVESCN